MLDGESLDGTILTCYKSSCVTPKKKPLIQSMLTPFCRVQKELFYVLQTIQSYSPSGKAFLKILHTLF
jgi:hypothetical protein